MCFLIVNVRTAKYIGTSNLELRTGPYMKKPRRGRPPLASGERREKQLHVLMRPDERQLLTELAKRNSRSVSEEVVRRLRATIAHEELWQDAIELRLHNIRTARAVLTENGWIRANDPRYGGEVLVPPGSSPPGPFITEEEANTPMPAVQASVEVERLLQEIFAKVHTPLPVREKLRKAFLDAFVEEKIKRKKGKGKDAA